MAALTLSTAVAVLSRTRAAWGNVVSTLVDYLAAPAMCVLSRAALQNIPTGVWTAITFDAPAPQNDPTGAWSSAQPTRWTPQTAGWYMCAATTGWASTTSGARNVDVWVNGAPVTPLQADEQPAPGALIHTAVVWVYLNGSTDYVEMMVQQTTGGTLAAQYTMALRAKWFHV